MRFQQTAAILADSAVIHMSVAAAAFLQCMRHCLLVSADGAANLMFCIVQRFDHRAMRFALDTSAHAARCCMRFIIRIHICAIGMLLCHCIAALGADKPVCSVSKVSIQGIGMCSANLGKITDFSAFSGIINLVKYIKLAGALINSIRQGQTDIGCQTGFLKSAIG